MKTEDEEARQRRIDDEMRELSEKVMADIIPRMVAMGYPQTEADRVLGAEEGMRSFVRTSGVTPGAPLPEKQTMN